MARSSPPSNTYGPGPFGSGDGQALPAGPLNGATARAELGVPGLRRWAGLVFEEFLTELQGARGVAVYDEMRRNDPVVGSMLRATIDILKTVNWAPEGSHKKTLKFTEECFGDMNRSLESVMNDVLTCIPFGWAICEMVFKERHGPDATPSSDFDDGRIGWDRIALRGQDSLFGWTFLENGDVVEMVQRAVPDYIERHIPLNKCLHFRTDTEKNNPEGISMLRPVYRPWYFKKSLEEVEAIGIERDFTGLMWVDMPRNATAADWEAARAITERSKIDEQAGITTRKGPNVDGRDDWTISLLASPGSKQIDVSKAIQRYADEMATAFLAQFLRLGQSSSAGGNSARGSYALSRSHKDLFYTALTCIVDMIGEEFNRKAIPTLMRLNGIPRDRWPTLTHGQIAPREIETLMTAVESFVKSGGLVLTQKDQEFIRDELDLPEYDPSSKPVVQPDASLNPQNQHGTPTDTNPQGAGVGTGSGTGTGTGATGAFTEDFE